MTSRVRLGGILRAAQVFFYLAFVFLWFKHNFPPLRGIRLSWPWALVPLAAVSLARVYLRARSRRAAGRRPGTEGIPGRSGQRPRRADWRRDVLALVLLVLVATVVRVPYLAHNYGLMDSDEAVPALMGKHIADGRPAPLYFYGATFQGSLPEHFAAVFYRLFGYSILMAKASAFLAFVAFLCVQFFLLKRAFSFEFACAVGVFYVLPWVDLVRASLDIGSGFPVVLFFGALIFYLTASLVFDDRRERLGMLGFVLGLAFWTHQIAFIFALTAVPFLIVKFRLRLANYLRLAAWSLVGAFPVVINEFASGFPLVRFLLPGEPGPPIANRIMRTRIFMLALFTKSRARSARSLLAVLAIGLVTIVVLVLLKKLRGAALVYPVFGIAFLLVYLGSRFSSTGVVRYMYILYVALPVFLGAPFLWIRSRLRYPAIAALSLFVFAAGDWKASSVHLATVERDHRSYSAAVASMLETGEKYWISDFWASYLLTSLSGERLTVASYSTRRYYPYELWYWNAGRNNWVFFTDREDMDIFARGLPEILRKAGVTFEEKRTDRFTLVYRVSQDIFPKIILADPPEITPEIRLAGTAGSEGRLRLDFVRTGRNLPGGLGFVAEIPGYSARAVPLPDAPAFSVDVPFPEGRTFSIRYGLTYAGLQLPYSMRVKDFAPLPAGPGQPRRPIEFLEGIGPQRPVLGRRMSILSREAALEISEPTATKRDVVLELFSPFDFADPFWYGDFCQSVSILVNGQPAGQRPLAYGRNRLVIKREPPLWRGRGDVVRLKFRYAMPTSMIENWKTAAFLERADLR